MYEYSSLLHKDCSSSTGGKRGLPTSAFRLLSGATVSHKEPGGRLGEIVVVGIRLCDRLKYTGRTTHTLGRNLGGQLREARLVAARRPALWRPSDWVLR